MKVIEAARDAIWQSWRATCAENADHLHTKVLFDRNRLPSFQNILASPRVNPDQRECKVLGMMGRIWNGAEGLADDLVFYGRWMQGEAEKRIGLVYPRIEVTASMVTDRPLD